MMDWTDVHYRQMARLLSKKTWLWTEMVVDKTIIHTQQLDRHLWFPPEQHPVVLQLGGSDPDTLAAAVKMALPYGYDEINLNCGCPSDRVAGAGCFGASLMLEAGLVARCMDAMARAAGDTPVNVKCRLGVDDADSYEQLKAFIRVVSEGSPVTHFIMHARKCFLKGLNPHQNRTIPPIRYEWVYALKRDFPHLTFSLNGNIQGAYEARCYLDYTGPLPEPGAEEDTAGCEPAPTPHPAPAPAASSSTDTDAPAADGDAAASAAAGGDGATASSSTRAAAENGSSSGASSSGPVGPAGVGGYIEGVMIGRQAYNDPWGVLSDADRAIFGEAANPATSRRQVLAEYCQYADAMLGRWAVKGDGHMEPGVRTMIKPLLNLFHGEKGSKKWKNEVDGILKANPATLREVLDRSLHCLPDEVLDAPPRTGPCALAATHGVLSAAEPRPVQLKRMPVPEDRAGRPKPAGGSGNTSGSSARAEARAAKKAAAGKSGEQQVQVDVSAVSAASAAGGQQEGAPAQQGPVVCAPCGEEYSEQEGSNAVHEAGEGSAGKEVVSAAAAAGAAAGKGGQKRACVVS